MSVLQMNNERKSGKALPCRCSYISVYSTSSPCCFIIPVNSVVNSSTEISLSDLDLPFE